MTRDFSVTVEREAEGFYVATVPEVGAATRSHARTTS